MLKTLRIAYLVAYNVACQLGWFYVLALTAQHFASGGLASDLWSAIEVPLKIVQTAAILEIVHAALGIVRSPVATTALQGKVPIASDYDIPLPLPRTRLRLSITAPIFARLPAHSRVAPRCAVVHG